MCDTMVALGNATKDGSVLFAKNSDRQPNEPHIVVRIPRKKYEKGRKLRCTYIEIEQAEETWEVLLLKPSWMWGAEMGSNEFGLTIGNEAVFTRESPGKPALLGMDMLRLALERCRSSEEALDMLIQLLGTYGQGGNCGYEKPFTYHNSFLIADRQQAWVLETAGDYWAAEQVKDVRSISNCLSIGKNYDRCHPDLVSHAIEKGWCKDERDFDFAKCYTALLFTHFSKARVRRGISEGSLEKHKGQITAATMRQILRSHLEDAEGRQFVKHSIGSVCMHGGFVYGDHTTGSYVASLKAPLDTHWVTGSSTPCLAVFKPLWLIEGEDFCFSEEESAWAVEYWKERERLHRMMIENRIRDVSGYLERRNRLEAAAEEEIESMNMEIINAAQLLELMKAVQEEEHQLISAAIQQNEHSTAHIKGSFYYKHYWKQHNHKLFSSR